MSENIAYPISCGMHCFLKYKLARDMTYGRQQLVYWGAYAGTPYNNLRPAKSHASRLIESHAFSLNSRFSARLNIISRILFYLTYALISQEN